MFVGRAALIRVTALLHCRKAVCSSAESVARDVNPLAGLWPPRHCPCCAGLPAILKCAGSNLQILHVSWRVAYLLSRGYDVRLQSRSVLHMQTTVGGSLLHGDLASIMMRAGILSHQLIWGPCTSCCRTFSCCGAARPLHSVQCRVGFLCKHNMAGC